MASRASPIISALQPFNLSTFIYIPVCTFRIVCIAGGSRIANWCIPASLSWTVNTHPSLLADNQKWPWWALERYQSGSAQLHRSLKAGYWDIYLSSEKQSMETPSEPILFEK